MMAKKSGADTHTKTSKRRKKVTEKKEAAVAAGHHPNAIRHKHHKPYRKRHISLLSLSVIVLASLMLFIGGQIISDAIFRSDNNSETNPNQSQGNTLLKSNYGFVLPVDLNTFEVVATKITEAGNVATLSTSEFTTYQNINAVDARPQSSLISPVELGSSYALDVATADADIRQIDGNLSGAIEYFSPKTNADYEVNLVSENSVKIDGVDFNKRVYKYTITSVRTPSLAGNETYGVQWVGFSDTNPISFEVVGLVNGSLIPEVYTQLINGLQITGDRSSEASEGSDVLGIETLNDESIADYASPSVVKIYKGICAGLSLEGTQILPESCTGGVGSGVLISSDGYIATNGHVVVSEPIDFFVEFINGLSTNQFVGLMDSLGIPRGETIAILSDPTLYAGFITGIYDEYDAGNFPLAFTGKQEAVNVALGDEPLEGLNQSLDVLLAPSAQESVVPAELIAYDYSSGDLYRSFADVDTGFNNSDVAILKIDIDKAPYLDFATTDPTNNQGITVLGFPGNAENQLVSQDEISVTVTNGSISSIREVSGGNGKIFQSDVDISAGNSGGPAINSSGDIVGLSTYVFGGGANESLVSYIRDINDVRDLIEDENISLDQQAETIEAWGKGLELYSQSRLSKAIEQFDIVQENFPSHRVVETYIANAEQGIEDGLDVKDFPIAILAVGVIVAAAGIGTAVVLVSRHKVHHHNYNQVQMGQGNGGPQAGSMPGQQQPPQPPATQYLPQQPMPQQPSGQIPVQQPPNQPPQQQPPQSPPNQQPPQQPPSA